MKLDVIEKNIYIKNNNEFMINLGVYIHNIPIVFGSNQREFEQQFNNKQSTIREYLIDQFWVKLNKGE